MMDDLKRMSLELMHRYTLSPAPWTSNPKTTSWYSGQPSLCRRLLLQYYHNKKWKNRLCFGLT